MQTRFRDRTEAGNQLAALVRDHVHGPAVVLAIPRGGVSVAAPVAAALGARLDVVVPRKLGAPGHEELGIGAVAPGVRVIDADLVARLHVSEDYLEAEIEREEGEIARRTASYRGDRPPVELHGVTAVLVDDGIATGGTARAAVAWARAQGAARVVLAVPVAPPETAAALAEDADEVLVLRTPTWFQAVGQWYDDFSQVSDREVIAALAAVR